MLHQVYGAFGWRGVFGQVHFVIPQPLAHLRGVVLALAGDEGEDVVQINHYAIKVQKARDIAQADAKAMDMCLTGRMMDAAEAEKSGLVARIIPADQLLEETLKAAQIIAGYSLPVVMMIKESVNRAFESSLNEGLLFERRVFHSAFALEDQKEGMAAFAEKRKATFKNR